MFLRAWRRFVGVLATPFVWIRGWLARLLAARLRRRRARLPVRTGADAFEFPPLAQEAVPLALEARYETVTLESDIPLPRPGLFALEAQDPDWNNALAAEARVLGDLGFGRLVFVHGTFVGRDPVSMAAALRVLVPSLPPQIDHSLQGLLKRQTDTLLRDNGNFLPEYARLFAAATDWGESVLNFHWSSGNHHAARLTAALELSLRLGALEAVRREQEATLVVGHSHAGQVFALLSRLVAEARGSEEPLLLDIARSVPALAGVIDEDALAALGGRRIQFVTLGAPARYRYFLGSKMRLTSIINHRGHLPRAGSLSGFPFTRDGDYIQQWGLPGTDFFAITAWERELNAHLDPLLGPGQSVAAWREATRLRKRVPDQGTTLLVDFGDAGTRIPNCVATLFGHGAYTRLAHMLALTRLLRKRMEREGD